MLTTCNRIYMIWALGNPGWGTCPFFNHGWNL